MKLRVLLVDDECSARKELRYLLELFEDVQIVGEAANALEALELIYNLDCSVIFLDIAMLGLNGTDLTDLLREKLDSPTIILTTAQEEYASTFAFAVNAVDYLLKPIHPVRLEEALMKVRQLRDNLNASKNTPLLSDKSEAVAHPRPLEVVPVEQRDKIILLHPNDIIFIYTDKENVYIKTQKDAYLTRFTLRELELRLNSTLFFRSHRCYLVNIRRMQELIPYFNGTYNIVVDDDVRSKIPMSRTKTRIFKEMLGL
ncbi:LytTR family transcriptional regulator DNA-binding domain-containing protein [Desulfosporosinus sp.]|uniref:LytR/AlgR family response regulator transcription factor n=1 Tax=Desulfosporosinus sp. TaxID=157907 RepID=UPI00230A686B|nr:LytTR family transcriptional regulator DNA-binding domain-containing protein [Desulfosporosinus sp.]MDA8224019.1 LytTR family transcriptional regulator DNA-binding domain-containing protein [Desulfitobacterium hafniense]